VIACSNKAKVGAASGPVTNVRAYWVSVATWK
jgi:hypothetical protein